MNELLKEAFFLSVSATGCIAGIFTIMSLSDKKEKTTKDSLLIILGVFLALFGGLYFFFRFFHDLNVWTAPIQ